MVSEWVLNERMSEMEQIVWSDFIIIIVTFIAMGWFFWSVYIRNKKKGMMNEKSNTHFCPLHCPCPSSLTIIQWGINIYNPHKLTPQPTHFLVKHPRIVVYIGSPNPPKGKPSETPTHHPLLPSSFFFCNFLW